LWISVCLLLLSTSSASAQVPKDPSLEDRLRAHATYLASPELGGRANGSEGIKKARDYIAAQFEQIGLVPAGEDGFFAAFSTVTHTKPSRATALQVGEHVLAEGVEFSPASFSGDVSFEAQAVFVGYGLSAPSFGYDDYAGVDVRDKVVIALSGAPAPHTDAITSGDAAYLLSPGSKAAVALANGARALLLVNDPRGHGVHPEQQADELPQLRPTPALAGISVGHLTKKAAARALASAEVELAGLQQKIDESGDPHSHSIDVRVKGNLSLERQTSTLYNVQASLPSTDNSPVTEEEPPSKDSKTPIVITAHYDGLGLGHAASLSDDAATLHPGADDNASGVAVLIEVARALAERPPDTRRPIIFAAPAGEELGLLGSRLLARTLAQRYVGGTAINFDMLGRLRDRNLQVARPKADTHVHRFVAKAATAHDLRTHPEALHARFTDHISFVDLGFQGLNITTGRHGDYHMPEDTLDKLNWEGMSRAHGFIEELVRSFAGH
jgi:hypothetical protein